MDGTALTIGALADGVVPGSPAAEALVVEWLAEDAGRRQQLADRLAAFTDARVERYRPLLGPARVAEVLG